MRALALAPLASTLARPAGAVDYASASEVFAAIERLTTAVEARLRILAARVPGTQAFAHSVAVDHARFRTERERLRRRLGVAAVPAPEPAVDDPMSLEALRAAQEALVHAHAEGLPAVRDEHSVDVLAGHMVELARHLTVIELWIEGEESRG